MLKDIYMRIYKIYMELWEAQGFKAASVRGIPDISQGT